jgi:acetyltransferase-like isoleucine patch superfamily enzyme
MPRGGTLIVGANVEIRRNFLAELSRYNARVVIGEGSIIGHDVIFGCSTSIELGKRVILGPQVYLSDGTHDYSADIKKAFLERGYKFDAVRLGDDSAVATHCTVTASIGERSMVSANSLVRKPIPAYYAVGGVPARLARYFGPEDEEPEEGRRERLVWEADRRERKIRQAEQADASRAEPAA